MTPTRHKEIAEKYRRFAALPAGDFDRGWSAMGVTTGEVGDLIAEIEELRAALKEAVPFVPSTEDDLLARLSAVLA